MTDLSPAAAAVLDATDYPEDWATRIRVAAALRATADQVVPDEPENKDLDFCFSHSIAEWHQWYERTRTRRQLLTIANELEVTHD